MPFELYYFREPPVYSRISLIMFVFFPGRMFPGGGCGVSYRYDTTTIIIGELLLLLMITSINYFNYDYIRFSWLLFVVVDVLVCVSG